MWFCNQALNFSAEPRTSAVFPDFRVIPEISANLVKKIFGVRGVGVGST